MKKLLFLIVVTGLCMSMKAQVEVRSLESLPMQKQYAETKAETLFAPTKTDFGNYTSPKKHKGNVTYTPFGIVTNADFAANDLSSLSLGFHEWNFTELFPDSSANRYYYLQYNGLYIKRSSWASTGFVFDPYSKGFDIYASKGLFEDNNGTRYGYRLDTLTMFADYRLPQGYNPASPDTLRIYLTYFIPYPYPTTDYVDFMTMSIAGENALCPKFNYLNPLPQKGEGTFMQSNKMIVDYILTDKDSVANLPLGYVSRKAIEIPIPNGFAVPPKACMGVIAKYLPGYNYNLNDTLDLLVWDGQAFISQIINKNTFSAIAWDYTDGTGTGNPSPDAVYLWDSRGYNTFLQETQGMRHKNPKNFTDSLCVFNSIYSSNYYFKTFFMMSLSVGDDTAGVVASDPCKYYASVSINGNIDANNLVLNAKGAYVSYLWNNGANTQTLTVTTPGKYWVGARNIYGCDYADTINVLFKTDSVCTGETYNFHGYTLTAGVYAIQTGADTIYKLTLASKPVPAVPTITRNASLFTSSSTTNNQWYQNDSIIAGATGQTYDWTQTGTGNYSVVVTNSNGCSAKAYKGIYTISGRIREGNNNLSGIKVRYFVDSITVTDYAGKYSFYIDGGAGTRVEPDTTNYKYSPSNSRNFPSVQKNESQNFTATPKTGIADITNNFSIHVYPNPASTKLYIKMGSQETADYVVYNIMGQALLQGKLEEVSVVNIESLAVGMYYLKVIGKGSTTVKFVKQ